MAKVFSALNTEALLFTPSLFTWNMCSFCCTGEKKDNNRVTLCLAQHRPITFHVRLIPTNGSITVCAHAANHSERGPLMQRRCNRLRWTTKCDVNQIVPFQNNTELHSKVQPQNCRPTVLYLEACPRKTSALFDHIDSYWLERTSVKCTLGSTITSPSL